MPSATDPRPLLTWPLLPVPDEHGGIAFPTLEQSVRQMIEVVLRTRPGEQLMRSQFGAGIANFTQQPNTGESRREIRQAIMTALGNWEQRIIVDGVDVSTVAARPTAVRVEIAYRIRRTRAAQQLGLTMEMGG